LLGNLKKRSILIATPFFNEESGILNFSKVLNKIYQKSKFYNNFNFKFLFVDDGSSDKTFFLLNQLKNNNKNIPITIHKHKKNLGYGATLQSSIKIANEDYLIIYDSDCSYDYQLIFKLIDKIILRRFDIINVSYKLKSIKHKINFFRQFLSSGSSLVYKLFFKDITKKNITVLTCSFRIYDLNNIKKIKIDSNDFNACSEILIKALIKNYKILEIPGKLKQRKFGYSKMNIIKNTINHLKFIFKIKFSLAFN